MGEQSLGSEALFVAPHSFSKCPRALGTIPISEMKQKNVSAKLVQGSMAWVDTSTCVRAGLVASSQGYHKDWSGFLSL
jgi:hypothetical protein